MFTAVAANSVLATTFDLTTLDQNQVVYGEGPDSDGDGVTDAVETLHGLDPTKPYDVWRDTDGDHLPQIYELIEGLDTTLADSDVFNNRRQLVMQAFADIQGCFASEQQITRMSAIKTKPSTIYHALLEERYFARMGFIGRVYQAVLARSPDLDGIRYYHRELGRTLSKQDMIEQFIHSKEFQRRFGDLSDEAFIALIPPQFADLPVLQHAIKNIHQTSSQSTISRSSLILSLIESSAYIKAFDGKNRVDVLTLLLTGQLPSREQSTKYQQWLKKESHPDGVLRALLASDAFRQARMTNISAASDDTDHDGSPDGEEFINGTDVDVKDNDVLGKTDKFVSQMLRDFEGRLLSEQEITDQVDVLKQTNNRVEWVKQLIPNTATTNQQRIELLFNKLYRRDATTAEFAKWQSKLNDGADISSLIDMMVSSSEYQARFY